MKVNKRGFNMMLPRKRDREERNVIPDYRTQDERADRTQEERPGRVCPLCNGSGVMVIARKVMQDCVRCGGKGVISN